MLPSISSIHADHLNQCVSDYITERTPTLQAWQTEGASSLICSTRRGRVVWTCHHNQGHISDTLGVCFIVRKWQEGHDEFHQYCLSLEGKPSYPLPDWPTGWSYLISFLCVPLRTIQASSSYVSLKLTCSIKDSSCTPVANLLRDPKAVNAAARMFSFCRPCSIGPTICCTLSRLSYLT